MEWSQVIAPTRMLPLNTCSVCSTVPNVARIGGVAVNTRRAGGTRMAGEPRPRNALATTTRMALFQIGAEFGKFARLLGFYATTKVDPVARAMA
jgi:hypothetical protein